MPTPSSVPPRDLSASSDLAPGAAADLGRVAAVDLGRAVVADMAASRFPQTAAVTVGPNGTLSFAPATVDIAAGGTVSWTWAAGNTMPHNVTSGDNPPAFAASPTQMSGSFTHTFPSAGSFFYFCSVHGRNVMNGTVKVH